MPIKTLYAIFFLSGTAALVFETVWFRLSGLVFGNSVWSATLILGGFMGGLATGNALISRYGHRISFPIRFYAALEAVIAVTGTALVLLFPFFEYLFSPVFHVFIDVPWGLNIVRFGFAFILILIPTTSMGATLPILVKALLSTEKNFGSVLGRLYGWNTLGAVLGALIGEIILIKLIGLRGTGLFAALFNLIVAFLAFKLAAQMKESRLDMGFMHFSEESLPPLSFTAKRLLLSAFLTGCSLLVLEVIWFRFLLLFFRGTSLVFAVMLAVVLIGIALGGLAASKLYRIRKDFHLTLPYLCFSSGILLIISFIMNKWVFYSIQSELVQLNSIVSVLAFCLLAVSLMFPVSFISGILFTMIGRAVQDEIGSETKSAGLLTVFNTGGALIGPFLATFLLLPGVGMEISFFIVSVIYGVTALVIPTHGMRPVTENRGFFYAFMGFFILVLIFFPFGYMEKTYFRIIDKRIDPAERIAVRESSSETIMYYHQNANNQPFSGFYTLVTNGHSMSGTSIEAQRYMKLFVYLPVALNPDMENALLISYGVGSTANALTSTGSLKHIDVVDISKDILEMSSIVFKDPGKNPLNDARVSEHIEDGRFFLLTSEQKYDLITAEPPPPKLAGIVNLYTEEYFRLIRNRLSPGGMTTYWLPVHSLHDDDSKSIIKAFCNVFEDCTLWNGSGLDWLLLGTNGFSSKRSESSFSRQWSDPNVQKDLLLLGFETPAQLGALFLADTLDLQTITEGSLPLTDNYPLLLSTGYADKYQISELYRYLMDTGNAEERFIKSDFINKVWPDTLKQAGIHLFHYQRLINNILASTYKSDNGNTFDDLYDVLRNTTFRTLPLWLLGSSPITDDIRDIVKNDPSVRPYVPLWLALDAVSLRQYSKAVPHMEEYLSALPHDQALGMHPLYLFILCMDGKIEKAEKISEAIAPYFGKSPGIVAYWNWMEKTFGMHSPL